MKVLSRLQILEFAQLIDLSQDRKEGLFPSNGSFVQAKRGDVSYWYYQGYERSSDGSAGIKTRRYVGSVEDPATQRLVKEHADAHVRFRERRRIASSLRRAGLPSPLAFDGAVINALAKAGVFDAGAVLIGSMAFPTYSGVVGVRMRDALMQTSDIDIAQARNISLHLPPRDKHESNLVDLLHEVDASFEPIFDRTHPSVHSGYKNQTGYRIEFLTSGVRRKDSATDMVVLKGIDGVSAQPVQYLEYLLESPIRSIVLHDDGIPVNVPAPARYGVHKLICAHMRERVATIRGNPTATTAKVEKDIAQASALINALARGQGQANLAAAWADAWRRGPNWRKHLENGVAKLDPQARDLLNEIVVTQYDADTWMKSAKRPSVAERPANVFKLLVTREEVQRAIEIGDAQGVGASVSLDPVTRLLVCAPAAVSFQIHEDKATGLGPLLIGQEALKTLGERFGRGGFRALLIDRDVAKAQAISSDEAPIDVDWLINKALNLTNDRKVKTRTKP